MASYRVDYTETKPGGHQDRQSGIIRGERSDVVIFLGQLGSRLVKGSVAVTEHTKSDGDGVNLGTLGF